MGNGCSKCGLRFRLPVDCVGGTEAAELWDSALEAGWEVVAGVLADFLREAGDLAAFALDLRVDFLTVRGGLAGACTRRSWADFLAAESRGASARAMA